MNRREELKLLNEAYKNAEMGMKSIRMLLPKIYDEEFAYEMNCQVRKFEKICHKADKMIRKKGRIPKGAPGRTNLAGWTFIQRKTALNTSTSHMADMVIQGNTRGITEMMKCTHKNPDAGRMAMELAEELMDFEEKNIEKLKRYL